jgi:hypothetical protein
MLCSDNKLYNCSRTLINTCASRMHALSWGVDVSGVKLGLEASYCSPVRLVGYTVHPWRMQLPSENTTSSFLPAKFTGVAQDERQHL